TSSPWRARWAMAARLLSSFRCRFQTSELLAPGRKRMTNHVISDAEQGMLDAQRATISELETPVMEIWDGILALPIIGTVDTVRAQNMTEALLLKIVETKSEIVILDITGVPVIDTSVSRHLLENIAAAKLLGAEVLLVGLAARTAMTLVHLGLDLAGVTT